LITDLSIEAWNWHLTSLTNIVLSYSLLPVPYIC